MFTHNFLPKVNLKRIDSPDGRLYETEDGNRYQSVTTFLSRFGKEDIEAWKRNVGEEYANRVSNRAASRGTSLHEAVEKFLLNEEVVERNPLKRALFNSTKGALSRVSNIRLIEGPLYSDVLRLAGTADLVADFDSTFSLIDMKSSGRIKDKYEIDSYFMQTAIYSLMVRERYGLTPERLVIIMAVEGQKEAIVFQENAKPWCIRVIKTIKELYG